MSVDLRTPLPHSLERSVLVRARRATVFRFFTDSSYFARWWGAGSTIDPRPGGAFTIRFPNAVVASGVVLAIEPERHIVLSYGFDSGTPIGPGSSRVAFTLEDHRDGTLVLMRHELADRAARDEHVQGWRYQLSVFANVAAAAQFTDLEGLCDRFLAAWNEEDDNRRRHALAAAVTTDVQFRDAYSCLDGIDDLATHLAAVRVHMPGVKLVRSGPARHCQGIVVHPWEVRGPDGQVRGTGTNVVELSADGRITSVTGIWG